jgi:hypothetical protein
MDVIVMRSPVPPAALTAAQVRDTGTDNFPERSVDTSPLR